ncbi:MAG: matrixin family metalloprotease [Actinomycetia bacterium]|nr:matrixin family metalloprotease [Actinomycetes bacterium]
MTIDRSTAEFLESLGYLNAGESEPTEALLRYQRFHGLEPTGDMDELTSAMMARPRCGVPDLIGTGLGPFGIGDPWPQRELTYGFDEVTDRLGRPSVAKGAIAEALRIWASVTPLKFKSVPLDLNPDFIIRFVTGAHGDGLPFDGPGRFLAHAYFPPPNPGGDLAGDAHFDDTEPWAAEMPMADANQDLVTVAIHEFGHSLGLDHSNDIDAIMFPVILGKRRSLGGDDIDRIQALYGAPDPAEGFLLGPSAGCDAVYSAPGELDLFTRNAMGGQRRRRHRNGTWQPWEELGGETDTASSVNLQALVTGPGDGVLFSRDYNKGVRARVISDGSVGPYQRLEGASGHSFFEAGVANGVGVYLTSGAIHFPGWPTEGPPDDPPPTVLYEARVANGRLEDWRRLETDVSPVVAFAPNPNGPSALIIGDRLGRLKIAEGTVGNWGPFASIGDEPRIDPEDSFWPIRACFTDDVLHLVVQTADLRLIHLQRSNNTWGTGVDLGGELTRHQLATTGSGRLHLATRERGGSRSVLLRTFDGDWGDWEVLDHTVLSMAADDGRLDLFLADEHRLFHTFRQY